MTKHCYKCRRKWIVSIHAKQDYICPDCEKKLIELGILMSPKGVSEMEGICNG